MILVVCVFIASVAGCSPEDCGSDDQIATFFSTDTTKIVPIQDTECGFSIEGRDDDVEFPIKNMVFATEVCKLPCEPPQKPEIMISTAYKIVRTFENMICQIIQEGYGNLEILVLSNRPKCRDVNLIVSAITSMRVRGYTPFIDRSLLLNCNDNDE